MPSTAKPRWLSPRLSGTIQATPRSWATASALDEDLREAFMALLLDSCAAAGSALLFVSHDARLAQRFARVVDLPAINLASTEPDLPSGGPQDPADEGPA